jgi:cell division protein FtsZ
MEPNNQSESAPALKNPCIKVFGIGSAGNNVMEMMIAGGVTGVRCVSIITDACPVAPSAEVEQVKLETKLLRGLGTGGDPERGRAVAEEQMSKLKAQCEGAEVIFILAGLGGGAGTGISPVLARAGREAGALVLGFVTLPFACEGNRRQRVAQQGLAELKAAADGVICLPNEKAAKLIDENTSVLETFKLTNQLLADGVKGIWRLLTHSGLIEIHFADLAALIRGTHSESCFAVAEAMGPTRSREVLDKLLAHPALNGGQVLGESQMVMVSLIGGPDLTMAEVNRVMEQINRHCEHAQVIMGAAIDEAFRERLAVTLIAGQKRAATPDSETTSKGRGEELDTQLLTRGTSERPGSRFVPPAPTLPPEEMQRMLETQGGRGVRGAKGMSKMRQSQLPLEIVSKGRFDKSEPTIHKGEDLDVPTYIRRGIALN